MLFVDRRRSDPLILDATQVTRVTQSSVFDFCFHASSIIDRNFTVYTSTYIRRDKREERAESQHIKIDNYNASSQQKIRNTQQATTITSSSPDDSRFNEPSHLKDNMPRILFVATATAVYAACQLSADGFVVFPPSHRGGICSVASQQSVRLTSRSTTTQLLSNFLIINIDDDDENFENEEEENEDDEEEEEQDDPYIDVAKMEFVETGDFNRSTTVKEQSIVRTGDQDLAETSMDWGGALGQLRSRMDDVVTGKSQDPSHALFRVMSSQTPNQQISQFIKSTKPEVVQAMSGTVSSLLGGLWQPMNGAEVVVKASGDKISSLCFQLQMTGYMFRNAEYVMALKELMDIQPSATLEDYRAAFDELDSNGSGFIDAAQVQKLLDDVYDGKTPAFEVESFIKFFDTNKDGIVSWEEFKRGLGIAFAKANEANSRLRSLTGYDGDDDDSPTVEPKIDGKLEIELENGKIVEVEAAEYVKSLKQEARALKEMLRREKLGAVSDNMPGVIKNPAGQTPSDEFGGIASYIAKRQGDLKALTEGISPEIVETMKKLINFVLEGGDRANVPKDIEKEKIEMEIPGAALHQLAFWQLVLGYRLREAEARGDHLKLVE